MKRPKRVTIKEVGPRDGLQNEKKLVSTKDKVSWINMIAETGISYIEVSSFVHPRWIPQLADASEVLRGIKRNKDVTYAALVPNRKGLERAFEVEVDEVSVFMSASEGHNDRNINKGIEETYPILEEVVKAAKQAGKTVRGYLSTVIACPYDGPVSPPQVRKVADRLFSIGIDELSLGETIGVAVPTQVELLLEELLPHFEVQRLAMHFHDTRGTALANIAKSLEMGISTFDGALGGLGGCPYAKGAAGNVATEDLLYMLHEMGIETGVDLATTLKPAQFIERTIGKKLRSRQLEISRSTGRSEACGRNNRQNSDCRETE